MKVTLLSRSMYEGHYAVNIVTAYKVTLFHLRKYRQAIKHNEACLYPMNKCIM